MQIKTTMRCHLTPVRMAINKKFTNSLSAGKGVEKQHPLKLLVGMQIGTSTMKNNMKAP